MSIEPLLLKASSQSYLHPMFNLMQLTLENPNRNNVRIFGGTNTIVQRERGRNLNYGILKS